ncbi:glycosyltransferase [Saccharolobus islandicus]
MKFSIAVRLLYNSGVPRIAIEEARNLNVPLYIYRDASGIYDLSNITYKILRKKNEKSIFTPIFTFITSLYASNRGKDATVDLDLIIKAAKIIKGPALFHDQFAGITGYIRKLYYGEDYALYIHETALPLKEFKRLFTNFVEKQVLKKSKVIITNSEKNRKILKDYGFNAKVVVPGCYPAPILPNERERIILAVATWDPSRKLEWYGKVARALSTKAKIIIAGTWTREDTKREFIKKFGNHVKIIENLTDDELRLLYLKASVLIRFGFSNERGPGMGVIEALCNGTPVVVEEELGSSDLITDGVEGYRVKDVEDAIQKVEIILENPLYYSKNAWSKGKELSWLNHAKKLKEILEEKFDI